jgi:ATP-dependent DNA helicase PIF1
MEEMLCSLASPCFLMWVSKGGQYKTRGNVITFPQDISQLCTTLPRLPEELDILVVRKPGARDPATYKDFRVRKDKVMRLLYYLKQNNPYYTNVTIQPPQAVDLPRDASILHLLSVVETPPNAEHPTPTSPDTDFETDDVEATFEPDELAQEQNLFAPGLLPGPSEVEAVCDGMEDAGLAGMAERPLPWPVFGPPLSEYTTEGLYSMAFPTLFPTGAADFTRPRHRHLALHEWVKHLIRYKDSRFASHPRFRFFALNMIFRHRAMQQGRFLFLNSVGDHNMTIGQLKDVLRGDNGPTLASKIVRCVKSVRGTRPYWYMEGAKLKDMITQIGTPTLFYTLSMADLSWPDLHRLMPEDLFQPGLTDSQSYQVRARNLANNPHIVSAYLSAKHRCLRDTIFQHLDLAGDAKVEDYWFRVEWQARGSGESHFTLSFSTVNRNLCLGHIHGFLWLAGALDVDNVDWSDPIQCATVRDYFSRFITASNPDPHRARPPQDCLLKNILPRAARVPWDFQSDHCDLCNRCQKHGRLIRGSQRCVPSLCHKRGSCRFHFPYPCTPDPLAYVDDAQAGARKRFSPARNDPWLNQHSKPVLLGWRANVDLQPVLDRDAAIKYISKYASKPETVSDGYHHALDEFCSRMPQDLPAENVVCRLFARMAADRDISAQEAVHLLLGDHLVGCTRSFVNLNAADDAPHMLQDHNEADDEDPAFEASFFPRYQARPDAQDGLSAVQFCCRFNIVTGAYPPPSAFSAPSPIALVVV